MILEKQDVFIQTDNYDDKNGCVLTFSNLTMSSAMRLKDVYILTETQLETLKQEYYGIGVKYGQENK